MNSSPSIPSRPGLFRPVAFTRRNPRTVRITPRLSLAAFSGLLMSGPVARAVPNFAAEIVGYSQGTGAAAGYDQPSSALGEPSRVTPGPFGGPVDPFSGPWQTEQLVSVGAGGSLTVRFQYPVLNSPTNPHGLDFLVFGSAAFLITNGDFSGGGITDGSLFGAATGPTRISVSADGSQFFTLDPAKAPTVDHFFPTDGLGNFSRAVNPALNADSFLGLGLTGIRERYDGSAGGTGFDIGWAQNASGQSVALDSVQYVRIDVLGDRAEIDGFSAIPEPSTTQLLILGVVLSLQRRRRISPDTFVS